MPDAFVNRVYDIKIGGYTEAEKNLKTLTALFVKMDETKRKTDTQLQKAISAGNTAAIDKLSAKIKELEASLKTLDAQRQKSAREVEILAKAEKLEAEARLTNTKNVIAQEKELERQAGNEQKRNKQAEASIKAQAGNYYALLSAQRAATEAYRLYARETGSDAGFQKVKQAAIDATRRVQEFNRSLAPDGTLVGEYKSGIINAFKDLGLTDVIRKQKDDITNQLNKIKDQNKSLAVQYRETAAAGGQAFNSIEKELRDNITLQETLNNSLKNINTSLDSTGSIGRNVTTSIKEGFKGLLFTYVGFQAAVSAVQNTFGQTVQLDSLNTALKNVSGTQAEFSVNQQFLKKTTDDLGLTILDSTSAFKNFYAASTQAGIGADSTRSIFFAAASASAALKLSQEDTNGVLLAFGQIASKGKVQAEELRGQIGERIPGAFSIAARAIGVTQQELNKMLEGGQVLSNEFLPKFAAELQKTFAGDTTKKVEGLQASINRLKNEFTSLIDANRGGFTGFLTIVINGLGLLIKSLPTVITLLTAYGVAWTIANAAMVRARLTAIATSISLTLTNAATAIGTVFTNSYAVANNFLASTFIRAAAASGILRTAIAILSGPIGIVLGVLSLLLVSFTAFGKAASNLGGSISRAVLETKALADVNKEASRAISEQTSKINNWIAVIKSSATSADTKRKAVEELTKIDERFGEVIKGNVIDLTKLDEAYLKVSESIRIKARAEAAAKLTAEKEQKVNELSVLRQNIENQSVVNKGKINLVEFSDTEKELFSSFESRFRTLKKGDVEIGGIKYNYKQIIGELEKQEAEARRKFIAYLAIQQKNEAELATLAPVAKTGFAGRTIAAIQADLKQANEEFEKAVIGSKEYNDLRAKIQRLNAELLAADAKDDKVKAPRASRLSAAQKDAFKDIDAIRDTRLAKEKKRFLELEIDEETYLKNILRINLTAIDAKLNLLKGKNAEERKQVADLHLDRITQEQETSKKLFDIYAKRAEVLKNTLTQKAQQTLDKTLENPNATFTQRSEARQASNIAQLNAQTAFNDTLLDLEKTYNQRSIENENNRAEQLVKIRKNIREESIELLNAQLRDLIEASDAQRNLLDRETAEQTKKILSNKSTTTKQKGQSLNELEKSQTLKGFDLEIEALKSATQKKFEIFAKGGKDEKEYRESLTKLRQAEANKAGFIAQQEQSYISKTADLFKTAINNVTGFFSGQKATQAEINKAIEAGVNLTKQAINQAYQAYFEGEKQRAERDKQVALGRLDIEQKQAEGVAQSEEEKESIRKQFDIKRQEAEKRAAEQKKAIALKQLAIEFAVSVVKTLAEYPFPYSLIPVAGLTALYLAQRSSVQKQAFAEGGYTGPGKDRDQTGHRVAGVVHDNEWVAPKWMNQHPEYGLLINKLEAVRKRGFAGGGFTSTNVKPFGGGTRMWGDNLKPPINPSSFLSPGSNSASGLDELKKLVVATNDSVNTLARQTNERIDNIKVQVVAREVEETNKTIKKVTSKWTIK